VVSVAEVVFKAVDKVYPNGVHAVEDLSLEAHDGEFLVLVGPSGCGKTTALRMVAGLEEISDGELLIGGRVVNDLTPKERDIAMVFQNYALYPHLSVAENIAFGLRLRKTPKNVIEERVTWAAKLLDLTPYLARRPKELSGGQRQRVAMGRAIVRQPQAFLMDEPLSNLDAKLRVTMRGEIESLQKRLGVTTVYVTHDQVEAMTMGDRVAVLLDGVLQQVDTPTNVYDRPANLFVAGFIGSPQMNLVQAPIDDGSVKLGEVTVPVPPELVGDRKTLVVGIRPEDLNGAVTNGRTTLKGKIQRVEALGATLLGYFSVDAEAPKARGVIAAVGDEELEDAPLIGGGGTVFCATFEPRSAVRIGDTVEVGFDLERLHFFDAETEANLRT
jgi:multiple sugar transport system ATP-binding protein